MKMQFKLKLLLCLLLTLLSYSSFAAEMHHKHTEGMHQDLTAQTQRQATEGGQAAFAAVIEIVEILEQDPNTDWDAVDIDLLRSHLMDMNDLMLNTSASKEILSSNKIRFSVSGDDRAIDAIQRMVPAHSEFIQAARGWNIEHELTSTGAILTITTEDPTAIKRLKALGFYGYMSLESHHQAHHHQMALGHAHQ